MHISLFLASALSFGYQPQMDYHSPLAQDMIAIYEFFNGENAFFTTAPSLPGTNWMPVKKAFCLSSTPNGPFKSFQYWLKNKGGNRSNNFYTANADELASGIDPAINTPDKKGYGYIYQGNLGYISPIPQPDMVPLYRAYNGSRDNHYFTVNKAELGSGQQSLPQKDSGGYGEEPIAGYVWPPQYC